MKQNKKLIAITGGIGAGKSSVCNILNKLGEKCISCDEINAELLTDESYLTGIRSIFPDAFIGGTLNKKLIKETIAYSSEKRKALNTYAHLKIKEKMLAKISDCSHNRIFVEVPLLNQTDYAPLFDKIWVVTAIRDKRVARIMYRDDISEDFANAIINTQTETTDYKSKTVIIYNNGNLEELEKKIKSLL